MKSKEIMNYAMLLALLIVCSQLSVPIGPVPISLQSLAVMLIAVILPWKGAVVVTGIYLMMGLIGLPVFSGGNGGFSSILSPSFGFIIGFIPMSMIISYLFNKLWNGKHLLVAMLIGNLCLYLIGLGYLAFVLTQVHGKELTTLQILQIGCLPFLLGDLAKLATLKLIYSRIEDFIRTRAMI